MSKVAIVTGAGKRVGRVLAEGLLADGWQVVAHVRNGGDEVPAGAIRAAADLSNGKQAAAIILAACPAPPSLLVNNAARFAADSLDDFSADELAAHMAVNVAAPALLTAAFDEAVEQRIECGRRIACTAPIHRYTSTSAGAVRASRTPP